MTFAQLPRIWFLADAGMPVEGWSQFAAYFTRQGFSCYASAPASAYGLATLQPLTVAVAHRCAPLPVAAAALAILSPGTGCLLDLMQRPPTLPIWLGVGEKMRVQRLFTQFAVHRLNAATPYVFQGLGHDLIAAPGWERVAHALRLWAQRSIVSGPLTRS